MNPTEEQIEKARETFALATGKSLGVVLARRMLTAALSMPEQEGWLDISTAPKDGRSVLLWVVHPNAAYSKDPVAEGWACAVIARWIDHNGGGWTWHGLCGAPTLWHPAPPLPAQEDDRG